MNHPSREVWMSYLYDESNAAERALLKAHLNVCADCRARTDEWQAARKHLDAWHVHARVIGRLAKRAPLLPGRPLLNWAAAAVVVLSVGFAFGRMTAPATDIAKVRTTLEPEFRQLLREEVQKAAAATRATSREETQGLLADYTDALEQTLAQDDDAIFAALDRIESQHNADYVSLRKDLDTVAVLTDASLRRTQQQLTQLADITPVADSNPINK